MLGSHCDFKLWPHPWPWPWIFKVKYWNCCNSGMGGLSRQDVTPTLWLSTLTSTMALTLDFQGQILKKSYLRNGMANWHGTKGMWVDRMLDSQCDFKLWPHPWPWPWILKVKYWNCCNSGMGGLTHLEWKRCEFDMMLDAPYDWLWAPVHGK